MTRFIDAPSLKKCFSLFGATIQPSPNHTTTTIILGDLERDTRATMWEGSKSHESFVNEAERRRAQGGQEIDLFNSLEDFIDVYPDSGLKQAVTSYSFIADFTHDESKKKPSREPGPSRSSRYLMASILKDKEGLPILGLKTLFEQ